MNCYEGACTRDEDCDCGPLEPLPAHGLAALTGLLPDEPEPSIWALPALWFASRASYTAPPQSFWWVHSSKAGKP